MTHVSATDDAPHYCPAPSRGLSGHMHKNLDAAIEVLDLHRVYGSGSRAFEAVRGVGLRVKPGTIHALLGVNGAGKTSLLEVIEGLADAGQRHGRASSGSTRSPTAPEVRRRTGVLLQRSGFSGDLTVRETLTMWAAAVTDPRPVDESLGAARPRRARRRTHASPVRWRAATRRPRVHPHRPSGGADARRAEHRAGPGESARASGS